MNATTNTNGRVLNASNTIAAGLSGYRTLADKVRYACEQLRPNPTTATVRDWLARHGVATKETQRSYVSTKVNAWRKDRGLAETGELPALSAELLAELNTNAEQANTEGERVQDTAPAANEHVPNASTEPPATPAGAWGFYLVAAMSMLVSFDTSWRFFEHNLHITAVWERAVLFSVLEMAQLACGYGMRANVIRTGRPGAPRPFAWLLCGLSGYMAWQLSGVAEGLARVALGPALGLVMLHLALGVEIRARIRGRATTWARIGRELRERLLSRLGLADDERDALARTRDRAARRVAWLLGGHREPPRRRLVRALRARRATRALRASNVAHDLAARSRMLAELAVYQHADELATFEQPSPWRNPGGAG